MICFSVITWPTVAVSVSRAAVAGLHLDGLGLGARRQRQVDAGDLVDVEPDARLLGDAEARELGAHRVDADGQERERVVAARFVAPVRVTPVRSL